MIEQPKRIKSIIHEGKKANYFLVDTECTKFQFNGREVDLGVYQKEETLEKLVKDSFDFLEKEELAPSKEEPANQKPAKEDPNGKALKA